MKTRLINAQNIFSFKFISLLLGLTLLVAVHHALAANPGQFWDNNGLSTPGNGNWDTSTPNWTSDTNLTAMPGVFTNGDFAEFTAGTNNINTLSINIPDNTVVCAGIATGFTGFTGATVTNITFSGAGSIGLSSGLQGLLCPAGGTMMFNVPLTGAGGIEPQGGVVTLNGSNTFTGNSAITSQLIIAGSGSLGGGNYSGSILNTGSLLFNTSTAQTMSGLIYGSGGTLTNIGTGVLTLLGTNAYTGVTMIGSGATLTLGSTGLFGTTNGNTFAGAIVNNGTFNFENNTVGSDTLNGAISGTGTVNAINCQATTGTTAPNGQLSLTGPNTYTGITTITNGYILINGTNGLGTAPATLVTNQLTMNMPLDGHIYGLRLQSHSVTLAPTQGVYVGATGSGVVGGAINAQAGETLTLTAPICGPGSFSAGCNASFGNGVIVLSNASSTYAGQTFIACGTLQLGVSGAIPSGSPLTLYTPAGAAATFNMNGFNQTIGPLQTAASLGGSGSAAASLKLTGALTVLETNTSTTFACVISGTGGSLTVNTVAGATPGVLSLTAANTYTGPTAILGATLALSGAGAINSSSNITIGAGGTFDVSGLSSPYNLSSSTSLSASGKGTGLGSTAATINGVTSGNVNLGSQPISLNFTPTGFTGDSAHPALYVTQASLTLNGNVISVTNSGATPLGAGTYVLIQSPAGISGTITPSVVVAGNGIAAGATAALSISGNNVILTVTSSGTPSRPVITGFTLTGSTLHITATNGTANGQYVLVEGTNLTIPRSSWKPILTNSFDTNGNINLTTNFITTNGMGFFSIQNP